MAGITTLLSPSSPNSPVNRSDPRTTDILQTDNIDNIDLDRIVNHSAMNSQLIDRLIDSPEIAAQLKKYAKATKDYPSLSFYTDRSLVRTTPDVDVMGLGWVIEHNESVRF